MIISKLDNMQSRREFINKSLRIAGMAVLMGGSGYLLFREESEEACDFDFVCKNCKKNKECKLPEAKTFNGNNKLKSNC
ncbi:MAG: hypothetical protein C0595_00015 [Marinilabiliales bacterium]|nr:MAG: hypothetical protein C0595_00015 [Marinilabiliales bacterium]